MSIAVDMLMNFVSQPDKTAVVLARRVGEAEATFVRLARAQPVLSVRDAQRVHPFRFLLNNGSRIFVLSTSINSFSDQLRGMDVDAIFFNNVRWENVTRYDHETLLGVLAVNDGVSVHGMLFPRAGEVERQTFEQNWRPQLMRT